MSSLPFTAALSPDMKMEEPEAAGETGMEEIHACIEGLAGTLEAGRSKDNPDDS